MVWNANCLPSHIPVHDADWFKFHLRQLSFRSDWLETHFLPTPLFSLQLETCHFYLAYIMHAKTHLAAKSDENIIVEGQRSIKAAQKDPSTTVVASIRLTGATVVGSTNLTEFWQRRTQPPSFLLLLSHKMDVAIPQ